MSFQGKNDNDFDIENNIDNVVFQIQDSLESRYNSHGRLSQGKQNCQFEKFILSKLNLKHIFNCIQLVKKGQVYLLIF